MALAARRTRDLDDTGERPVPDTDAGRLIAAAMTAKAASIHRRSLAFAVLMTAISVGLPQ